MLLIHILSFICRPRLELGYVHMFFLHFSLFLRFSLFVFLIYHVDVVRELFPKYLFAGSLANQGIPPNTKEAAYHKQPLYGI